MLPAHLTSLSAPTDKLFSHYCLITSGYMVEEVQMKVAVALDYIY